MYAVDSPSTRESGPSGVHQHRSSGRTVKRRRQRGDARTPWLLVVPTLLILLGLLGYPLYRMVVLSFQNMRLRELLTGATPPWVGFDQYHKVLTDSTFWTVVWHTALFTVVSVLASVLLGLAVALLMRRVSRGVRLFMII